PVSGGGLAAGAATAATGLQPGIRVIGVEPEEGDDTRRSLAAGHRVALDGIPRTIADGQGAMVPGELTFPVNQRLLAGVELVSEEEILAAMRFAFERLKIVIEPSGATGLAALLAGRIDPVPQGVGVIISGGNVGMRRFMELMEGSAG
ncbi:MAG: pyridoxal-phosphate dependent enzyme, partial [Streptomyces sp.]